MEDGKSKRFVISRYVGWRTNDRKAYDVGHRTRMEAGRFAIS